MNAEFHILGENILSCILVNILLTTLMILLIMVVLNRFQVTSNTRIFVILMANFFPYSIIITNSLWRESIHFFFLTASFFKYIDYIQTDKYADLFVAVIATTPVLLLHVGYFPIILAFLIDILLHDKGKHGKIHTKKLLIISTFLLFIILAFSFGSVDTYLTQNGKGVIEGIIDRIAGGTRDESVATAGSLYLPGVRITSIGTLILYTPLKFLFYLLSPLPMNWRNLLDIIAFLLDGCLHCYLIGFSIKRLAIARGNAIETTEARIVKVGVYASTMCALAFCLGTTTAGTAIRHRCVLIGVELITYALASKIDRRGNHIDSLILGRTV